MCGRFGRTSVDLVRRGLVAILAVVALASPWTPVQAGAQDPPQGQFNVVCKLVTVKSIDPITGSPETHQHQFFGSKSVALGEAVDQLQTAGTTCSDPQDTASYWAPTLYV